MELSLAYSFTILQSRLMSTIIRKSTLCKVNMELTHTHIHTHTHISEKLLSELSVIKRKIDIINKKLGRRLCLLLLSK